MGGRQVGNRSGTDEHRWETGGDWWGIGGRQLGYGRVEAGGQVGTGGAAAGEQLDGSWGTGGAAARKQVDGSWGAGGGSVEVQLRPVVPLLVEFSQKLMK